MSLLRKLLFPRRSTKLPRTSRLLRPALELLEERLALAADILVTTAGSYPQQFVKEFTPTGTLVRQLTVPPPLGSSGDTARDLVADPSGNLYVYNGTFTPSLATWNSPGGQWTQQNYTGWGTVNNMSYGGLGLYQGYVFASDMTVGGDPTGASNGVVRFNVPNGSATRFAQGTDFIDVNVGADNKVYALTSSATVSVFDPNSMALLRTLTLPAGHDYRGIAVNANGDLFTANWDNSVSHFTSTGALVASVTLTGPNDGSWFGNPMNISLAADGTLAVGTRSGHAVQMTSALTNISYIDTWTGSVQYGCFATFAAGSSQPGQPTLSVADVSANEGNSGTTPFNFTVTLSSASSTPVTVSYATSPGTAKAGTDYTSQSGSVTFAPGQTSLTVAVPVVGNTLNEANKTFFVTLSNPAGATLSRAQATGTIVNDDPVPSLTIGDVSANEGNSGLTPFTFTATLSAASGQTVQVYYYTSSGTAKVTTDYYSTSGYLTFTPGQTTQTVTVNVVGNTYLEPNKTFFLNLSSPLNVTIARATATGTILNDDTVPGLSVGDVSVWEGNSGTTAATFTVTLSAALGQSVTVNYATADGFATVAAGDYQAASGTLTFAAGQTSQTVAVLVNGNTLYEANETFYLNLSNPVRATLARGGATGTILNDDPAPALSVNDVSLLEGNSGTTNAVFTVSLSAASGQTTTVWYATANGTARSGTDYNTTSGSLTFAPGQTSQQVYVQVIGNTLPEASKTFTLNLSSPLNATLARSQGTGTILNDDTGISVADVSANEGNSGTTAFVFTVSLSYASAQTVVVNYATANGSATASLGDYQAASGQLSFAPGQTSQVVVVLVNGNTTNEANETFYLNLSSPINATLTRSQATGTILNDDPVPPLSVADISANEGNSGTTPFNFTVSLAVPSGQWVYVNYATSNGTGVAGTDYQTTSGTAVFAPGQLTQTVTVPVIANTINQPTRTFFLNLSNPINATFTRSQAIGTIIDDDPVSKYEFTQPHAAIVDDMAGQGTFTQISSGNYSLSVRKFTGPLQQGIPYDERSIMEYDVHTMPIQSLATATFTYYESGYTSNSAPVLIYGYVGDGWMGTGDATSPGVLLGSYDPTAGLGLHTAGLDAAAVRSVIGSSGWTGWLGIRLVGGINTNTQINGPYAANPPTLDFTLGAPPPLPGVSVNDVTATEGTNVNLGGGTGATPFTFTVSLSQASPNPVTVTYQTADGSAKSGYGNNGYVATSGTLIFTPGQTQQTVTVPVYADNMNEPTQTFSLQINAANATVARGTGTGTILDDDPVPHVSVSNTGLPEGNSGISYASFTISLTNPSYQNSVIQYTTADGTALAGQDYVATSGSVVIGAGQTMTWVNVGVIGNKIVEPNKTFALVITNGGAAIVDPGTQGVCTIYNDDHAPVVHAGPNQTANEAATVSFDASGSTDADNDPLTFAWNFGDGGTGTGARPTHVYADNGVYTATVSVSDGYNVSTGSLTVTVLNVPPTAAVSGPADAVPGQDRTFTFTATDPSPVDQTAPFSYQINWGDGTSQSVQGPGSGIQVDHVYTATGSFAVSVTATDKDNGTSAAATQTVAIVAAELQGGDLYVGGTTGDDHITIQPADANGTVDVVVNGQDQGTFVPTGQVVAYGLAGNNLMEVVPLTNSAGTFTIGLPVMLFGGDGNDTLDARGASGPTVLVGGAGDDTLLGGSGRNVEIGGTGSNVLQGGNDADLLLAGTTVFDANPSALMAIRGEWARTDIDYQTIINHLNGSLAGGLNGAVVLNGQTVTNNGLLDQLYGSLGQDWFLVSDPSLIKDLEAGEVYTVI